MTPVQDTPPIVIPANAGIHWLAPITGMFAAAQLYEWLRGAGATVVPRGVAVGTEGPITREALVFRPIHWQVTWASLPQPRALLQLPLLRTSPTHGRSCRQERHSWR